jgi:hypothetical protein
MISYFSSSITDIFNNPDIESTIIVPITDIGFIQDASIRNIAINNPEIWAGVLTYCSGRNDGLISRHIEQQCNTQLVFISCITTKNGCCELLRETYLQMLDTILSSSSRTCPETHMPTIYLIEPSIGVTNVFNQTIEDIASLSTKYGVGLNYVLPSSIL